MYIRQTFIAIATILALGSNFGCTLLFGIAGAQSGEFPQEIGPADLVSDIRVGEKLTINLYDGRSVSGFFEGIQLIEDIENPTGVESHLLSKPEDAWIPVLELADASFLISLKTKVGITVLASEEIESVYLKPKGNHAGQGLLIGAAIDVLLLAMLVRDLNDTSVPVELFWPFEK